MGYHHRDKEVQEEDCNRISVFRLENPEGNNIYYEWTR
jgi:hypothetical protein